MNKAQIVATLTEIAKQPKSADRATFNDLVRDRFDLIGAGAFRLVFCNGDTVIKVRRADPSEDNPFPIERIDKSNDDEATCYNNFKKREAVYSRFVLEPTLVSLPNGNNAVLMDRVDFIWGDISLEEQDAIEQNNKILYRQIMMIGNIFRDGHDGNIGIKGNRAYLIDFNMPYVTEISQNDDFRMEVRTLLESVGEKFQGRKKKSKPTQEAKAAVGA